MSGNIIFMIDNQFDRATSISASSELSGLPVANLQNHQRTSLWRSDGNSGEASIDIILSATERGVSGVALVDHNLSVAGKIRIQAWSDGLDGAVQVVDQAIQPHPVIFGFGEQLFGKGLFGGYQDLGTYSSFSLQSFLRPISFLRLDTAVDAIYWRITLIDATPDYFQCGRVYIGEAWQPATNYSWGSKLTRVAQSNKRESRGGQTYSNPRPGRMVMEFNLDWLQFNDQVRLWSAYLPVETDVPIIVVQDPAADSFDRELRSLYCTFDGLSVESAFQGNHKSPIKLIEVL